MSEATIVEAMMWIGKAKTEVARCLGKSESASITKPSAQEVTDLLVIEARQLDADWARFLSDLGLTSVVRAFALAMGDLDKPADPPAELCKANEEAWAFMERARTLREKCGEALASGNRAP